MFGLREYFGYFYLSQCFLVLYKKWLEYLQIPLEFRNCLRSNVLGLEMKALNFFLEHRNEHFLSERLIIESRWLIANLVKGNIFSLGEVKGGRRNQSILLAMPTCRCGHWWGIILVLVSVIHKCLYWHESAAPVILLLIFYSLIPLLLIHFLFNYILSFF